MLSSSRARLCQALWFAAAASCTQKVCRAGEHLPRACHGFLASFHSHNTHKSITTKHTTGFVTYQVDKPPSSGKVWELHRRCTLSPSDASHFRASERHLRKAGPLRALASRDKKNALHLVRLICFWREGGRGLLKQMMKF